jgi:DNA repair exonuclease SbcCD ATPase subunit
VWEHVCPSPLYSDSNCCLDSRLADRAIAAESQRRDLEAETKELEEKIREVHVSHLIPKSGKPATPPKSSSPAPTNDPSAQLRAQLADAQRARASLETQVSTIPGLEAERTNQAKAIVAKDREIVLLKRKLRDQAEEIKEKKKMGEQVQDEMISLNLQVNIAEQKAEKLQNENAELVERWMKRMGEEAEKMNEQSRW